MPHTQIQLTPSQLLLPELTSDPSDKLLLIEQQAKDPSLSTIRELAQQQLRGYAYLDGVVIFARHLVTLKLAHNSDFGGHCGVRYHFHTVSNLILKSIKVHSLYKKVFNTVYKEQKLVCLMTFYH